MHKINIRAREYIVNMAKMLGFFPKESLESLLRQLLRFSLDRTMENSVQRWFSNTFDSFDKLSISVGQERVDVS
jgi:hypothetical protein